MGEDGELGVSKLELATIRVMRGRTEVLKEKWINAFEL